MGWELIAGCRKPEEAKDVKKIPGKVNILPLDVTCEKSIAAAATTLRGKPIDILINNAEGSKYQLLHKVDDNVFGSDERCYLYLRKTR